MRMAVAGSISASGGRCLVSAVSSGQLSGIGLIVS
jgi:hypothetical protein